MEVDELMEDAESIRPPSPERMPEPPKQDAAEPVETQSTEKPSSGTNDSKELLEFEEQEQTKIARIASAKAEIVEDAEMATVPPSSPVNLLGSESPEQSPAKSSLPKSPSVQPHVPATTEEIEEAAEGPASGAATVEDHIADVTRSPSDGSSPIRPLVRKSSMNFASLPAREPLASNKSLGARMSRTSHIDQTRASYFPRHTGGKSLGVRHESHEDEHNAMEVDDDDEDDDDAAEDFNKDSKVAIHSKTYTQRLQDQISMLGKSQTSGTRLSKSIPNLTGTRQSLFAINQPHTSQTFQQAAEERTQLPSREQPSAKTPNAFPEDDDDDWIAPPSKREAAVQSPRPAVEKSYSADVMEGVHGKSTIGGAELDLLEHRPQAGVQSRLQSPRNPTKSNETTSSFPGHTKSASVPDVPHREPLDRAPGADRLGKALSVSNPIITKAQHVEMDEPPRSPTRSFRESPMKHSALKQVKNKFSSILKGSKGLLASSAALSAESKASLVNSPSNIRLGKQVANSTESFRSGKETEPLYPDLTQHMPSDSQPVPTSSSPSRPSSRRTRASTERVRKEQKQKEREEKEAQHLAAQMEKLEKEREKEREKARVFSKEQDKIAAETQLAAQKEHEKAVQTPALKEATKSNRTSPRKGNAQPETEVKAAVVAAEAAENGAEDDVDMTDAPASKPAPPSIPRPTPGQTLKHREIKRPMKPTREAAAKPRQAPTLIRVNTSSQHTGFHPTNSVLAATLQDTLGTSQPQLKGKTSQPSLQTKSSQQRFSSSVNSTIGRPKALDLAAKRKQQEEREAQRKRDAKADLERKRAAMREEERRQEQERREKERKQAAAEEEAKKRAQRQAAIEKAKQTRAPPPPVRSQPNGPPEYNSVREKAGIPRPPSRLHHSTAHRSQEDVGRPVNAVLSSTAKMSLKRPLQQDGNDDGTQRPTASRNGLSQQKEVKRMRMSDEFNLEEEMEIQSYGTKIKGPPIRPSAGYKKVSCRIFSLPHGIALTKLLGFTQQVFIRERAPPCPSGCDSRHLQSTSCASAS